VATCATPVANEAALRYVDVVVHLAFMITGNTSRETIRGSTSRYDQHVPGGGKGEHQAVRLRVVGALTALDAGLAILPGEENLLFPRTGALMIAGRKLEGIAEARALLAIRLS
jgi:hypothetical protein